MRDFETQPGQSPSSKEEGRPGDERHDTLARLLQLAAPRTPISEERKLRIEDTVRRRWETVVAARRRRRWLGVGVALAAGMALVATVAVVERSRAPGPPPSTAGTVERLDGTVTMEANRRPEASLSVGSDVPIGAVITTGSGSRVALRLPSGASVRIDQRTTLQLVRADRADLEQGAVYLDTGFGVGDHRSFEVRTPITSVHDVGTQFEVRIVEKGSVRVRVREGSVTLETGDTGIEAEAGTEILMDRHGSIERAGITSHAEGWSWVSAIAPPYDLEGRPLAEFLEWYRRETGRAVFFADPELERTAGPTILHGSIEDLPPRQSLLAVLPTCGLEHESAPGAILLRKAGP